MLDTTDENCDYIENFGVPILLISKSNGRILRANGFAHDVLEISSRSLKKLSLADLFLNQELVEGFNANMQKPEMKIMAYDIVMVRANSKLLNVDISLSSISNANVASLVFWPKGRGEEYLESQHSIQRDRSFGQIGRSLAHEVKNPLSGIRGAAQLILQDATNEQKPLANLIIEETDRIRRLIDKVETLGFDNNLKLTPINVHVIIERIISLIESEFGQSIIITRDFDVSLPLVLAETDALTQILLNLAKNAAQALSEKPSAGNINFATKYRHDNKAISQDGKAIPLPIEVTISDNGYGIPKELHHTLFDPFITTKPNGTGLGLALVRKLASALNGQVEFESIPGRTSFKLRLSSAHTSSKSDEMVE